MDVKITDLSTLRPKDITILNDPNASTITITDTPLAVTVAVDQLAITTSAESSNLGDLQDVSITGVANGQLIAYNSSTSKWENSASSTGVTSVNSQTGVVTLDTDNISEGSSNLYYTNARFDTQLATKSTTNLSEGTNLYYTDGRFDTRLASKDTGDLSEGTNLYYTDGRFDTRLAAKTTDNLTEGSSNLYYTDTRVQTKIDANSAGFITASSTNTLTNKSGNISMFTNDAGYLTSETDSQTLSFSSPNLSISGGNSVDISALTSGYITASSSDTLTNKSGNVSMFTNDSNYITASSSDTLTNKSGNVSMFTNDSGYLTSALQNVVEDTTPQLGGNLDVNGKDITSTSNGAIELDPDGSGNVIFKGNATRGAGQFVLNCENNSHGITIKGPPHSAAASYTLTLPNTDGSADQVLKTDGSGNLDWVAQSSGGIANVVDDTSPQLGGDLDVNGQSIVSTSNGNIVMDPNGTGAVTIEGDSTVAGNFAARLARLANPPLVIDNNQSNAWWGSQLIMKDNSDDIFAMVGREDTSNKVYGYIITMDPNGTHTNSSAYAGDYGYYFNMQYEGGSGNDEWYMIHNVYGADDGYFINSFGSGHNSYARTPLVLNGSFTIGTSDVDLKGLEIKDSSGSVTVKDNMTVNLNSGGTTALVTENESATASGNRITVGTDSVAHTSGIGFEVRRGTGSTHETQFKVETASSRTRTTVTSAFNLAPVAYASLHGAPSVGDLQFLTTDGAGATKNLPIFYNGSDWFYMTTGLAVASS